MGTGNTAEALDGSGLTVAVVVSRYNREIGERLLAGALATLAEHAAPEPEVHWVPGALEIPLAAQALAETGRIDAVVCLGAVIKGETAHFEHVASQCAAGVAQVALETGTPCTFGVLTTYDLEQALARSDGAQNKGREAAEAALEMVNLLRRLRG